MDLIMKYGEKVTIAVLLAVIVYLSWSGEFVWKRDLLTLQNQLQELKKERDTLFEMVLQAKSSAETAIARSEGLPGPMLMSATPEKNISLDQLQLELNDLQNKAQNIEVNSNL